MSADAAAQQQHSSTNSTRIKTPSVNVKITNITRRLPNVSRGSSTHQYSSSTRIKTRSINVKITNITRRLPHKITLHQERQQYAGILNRSIRVHNTVHGRKGSQQGPASARREMHTRTAGWIHNPHRSICPERNEEHKKEASPFCQIREQLHHRPHAAPWRIQREGVARRQPGQKGQVPMKKPRAYSRYYSSRGLPSK